MKEIIKECGTNSIIYKVICKENWAFYKRKNWILLRKKLWNLSQYKSIFCKQLAILKKAGKFMKLLWKSMNWRRQNWQNTKKARTSMGNNVGLNKKRGKWSTNTLATSTSNTISGRWGSGQKKSFRKMLYWGWKMKGKLLRCRLRNRCKKSKKMSNLPSKDLLLNIIS